MGDLLQARRIIKEVTESIQNHDSLSNLTVMVPNRIYHGDSTVPKWVDVCSGEVTEQKKEIANMILVHWFLNRRTAPRYRPKCGCPYHQPSTQVFSNKILLAGLATMHGLKINISHLNSHPESFCKVMKREYERRAMEYPGHYVD